MSNRVARSLSHREDSNRSLPPQVRISSLDDVVKVLAVIAGFWYVMGLLSSNFYLYQIGASDFAVVRSRFILTGALGTIPFFLVVTILAFVRYGYQEFQNNKENKYRIRVLLNEVLVQVVLALLIYRANRYFRLVRLP